LKFSKKKNFPKEQNVVKENREFFGFFLLGMSEWVGGGGGDMVSSNLIN
jgi:hypothetical protein